MHIIICKDSQIKVKMDAICGYVNKNKLEYPILLLLCIG